MGTYTVGDVQGRTLLPLALWQRASALQSRLSMWIPTACSGCVTVTLPSGACVKWSRDCLVYRSGARHGPPHSNLAFKQLLPWQKQVSLLKHCLGRHSLCYRCRSLLPSSFWELLSCLDLLLRGICLASLWTFQARLSECTLCTISKGNTSHYVCWHVRWNLTLCNTIETRGVLRV